MSDATYWAGPQKERNGALGNVRVWCACVQERVRASASMSGSMSDSKRAYLMRSARPLLSPLPLTGCTPVARGKRRGQASGHGQSSWRIRMIEMPTPPLQWRGKTSAKAVLEAGSKMQLSTDDGPSCRSNSYTGPVGRKSMGRPLACQQRLPPRPRSPSALVARAALQDPARQKAVQSRRGKRETASMRLAGI